MNPAVGDRVFLEGLRLSGAHGVYDEERQKNQDFLLDISVAFDTRAAGASDDIADTIDYTRFKTIAEEVIGGPSQKLLEHLADTIATRILEDKRIAEVSVSIRKPDMFPNAVPGVSITRRA